MRGIFTSCAALLIIASVCVSAMAYAHMVTLEPIARQVAFAGEQANKELFPDADEYKKGEKALPEGSAITQIITAYKSGDAIGYIVNLGEKGYSGTISLMTGINMDGSISGIKVISHSETPGLGALCEKDWFTDKYKGKTEFPLSVVKNGAGESEIDSITSSTITTKAITDAVNTAHDWFVNEGGGK